MEKLIGMVMEIVFLERENERENERETGENVMESGKKKREIVER